MAPGAAQIEVSTNMKAVIALAGLTLLVGGCSHERTPYTSVDITNNPPQADPSFTNPVLIPTSDRTNSRVYPSAPTANTNAASTNRAR
jgi:PBP1b-binding outer membrane lipoprotein LpoB